MYQFSRLFHAGRFRLGSLRTSQENRVRPRVSYLGVCRCFDREKSTGELRPFSSLLRESWRERVQHEAKVRDLPGRHITSHTEADGKTDKSTRELHAYVQDMEEVLFNYLSEDKHRLSVNKFKSQLFGTGLRESDPRLRESMENLAQAQTMVDENEIHKYQYLDKDQFKKAISPNIVLISKAFRNQFIIPEFPTFCNNIDEMFWQAKGNPYGEVANYIPQLARYSPDLWGLAVCTIDGQRHALGDAHIPFCIQSVSKPLTYAQVLNEIDPHIVHQFVGQEPSGTSFNAISLNQQKKPHNPMINSGAIVLCSLLKPELNLPDRFDYNVQSIKRLAGNEYVSFNNSVFLSERETADRNFALAYYMRENKCFPPGTNLTELMDFYFQQCSVETTCDSGAVIAATLANGGICPITGDRVLNQQAVRNTLSLMHSCGMYDYSGQFAFTVGLPAKSGVSGAIMLVVPNVMGIFMWSPPLDNYGNSVRGIQFCKDLVRLFNFHNYDNLRHTSKKMDPRKRVVDMQASAVVTLLFSAFNGDETAIRRCALSGMDMNVADYDGRTAIHIASAEGHANIVRYLIHKCHVRVNVHDRWGFTPLDDAQRFGKTEVVRLLEEYQGLDVNHVHVQDVQDEQHGQDVQQEGEQQAKEQAEDSQIK